MAHLEPKSLTKTGTASPAHHLHRCSRKSGAPIRTPPRPDPCQTRLQPITCFKDASAFCRVLKQDRRTLAAYRLLTKRRSPGSHLRETMIADILAAPRIKELILWAYHGRPGNTIEVYAADTVAVARLVLSIRDETAGRVLETTEQLYAGDQLAAEVHWTYTASQELPAGHTAQVTVTACDLAGNLAELTQSKAF